MLRRSSSGRSLLVVLLLLAARPAAGLSIVGVFFGGTPPDPGLRAGAGDLDSVFAAAADLWETVILDEHTVTVSYGWSSTGSSLATTLVSAGPDGRAVSAVMGLDNQSPWFFDGTPHRAEEWGGFEEILFDAGAGPLVVGRDFLDPTGDALLGWDLFTILLHEIGHALGMGQELAAYQSEIVDGDIDIGAPLPFAGSTFQVTGAGGAHLLLTPTLMFPSVDFDARTLMSDADVLAVAQVGGFSQVNLVVPEPGTLLLLTLGSIGLALARLRV